MPDDDLGKKIDRLLDAVQEQNIKLANLDGKVDIMNSRINTLDTRMHDLHGVVMRREGISHSVEEVRKDLSTKFMWCIGYATALGGVIVALLRYHP